MTEQTAATAAHESAPEAGNEATFDTKLAKALGLSEEPTAAPATEEAPAATQEVAEGELAPEDIAADEQPKPEEWLELDRKGELRKVSKEEAKRLAQMGWDYSANQEALNAEKAQVEELKKAVTARQTITPQIVEAAATVKAVERQLAQYKSVDWAAAAQQLSPQDFQAARMQFEQLRESYGQAWGQLNQTMQAGAQVDQVVTQAELQQQMGKVYEKAPELRDEQRRSAEFGRIRSYLTEAGLTTPEIDGIADARYLLVARDAMRYRQALKARAERATNTSAPALTPSEAAPKPNPGQAAREVVKQLHEAKDPIRKKDLFGKALEAKLSRAGLL